MCVCVWGGGAGKNVTPHGSLIQASQISHFTLCFYVQKGKISFQMPKFPCNELPNLQMLSLCGRGMH